MFFRKIICLKNMFAVKTSIKNHVCRRRTMHPRNAMSSFIVLYIMLILFLLIHSFTLIFACN